MELVVTMMLRSLLWTTLGLACLLLTACDASTPVKAGTVTEVASGQTLRAPDSTSASGAYSGVSEYRIGAQDLIEISVFQVPDLSRAVRVNTGGQISLPLIGVVQAGFRSVSLRDHTTS